MAAYGTLLSLTNTIDQIQNHPRPPISLDKLHIEPLIEKVAFLQNFLENYLSDDANGLEGRMIDVAHKAEDIIESHIVDHFENEYLYRYIKKMKVEYDASHEARGGANISWNDDNESLYGELHKVMADLDSITKDVAAVKEKAGKKFATEDYATLSSDDVMNDIMDKLNNSPCPEGDDTNTMAGVMKDIMGMLTDQQSSRRIIVVAGMGGIGKTTLAKSIYKHPTIVHHFDKYRGWATVSQEFDPKRILLQVLSCFEIIGNEDSEHEELGQILYKSLFGQRYLIVMDDIWGTDAWDGVKRFFPNNNDGSKVLITTRLSNVALQLGVDGPEYFQMRFLSQNESWNLLRRCVFGEQGCPPELEEIGKDIAKKCRGLPLSIVVIGELLAKSEQTQENWKHIAESVSSIADDERCFRILQLSYNKLPVHLKPCFLYTAMFREDCEIEVPTLMKLWIDEGFVKPDAIESLEEVARLYLHDLVFRNLILVRELGPTRRIKRCAIHDLLRNLCIKEAKKYKFFHTMETTHNNPEHHDQISWSTQRRIGIHEDASEGEYIPRPLPEALQSTSRARTLIGNLPSVVPFRLLRILNGSVHRHGQEFFLPVNLCHLTTPVVQFPVEFFYRLWNVRTLIVGLGPSPLDNNAPAVLDIWRMPQLRHVKVAWGFRLTDPPHENCWMVLENLETLKTVWNMKLGGKVVESIPNIKKLRIQYFKQLYLAELTAIADYGLNNLRQLSRLEAFSCTSFPLGLIKPTFPYSLRKLTLGGTYLRWKDMATKIGSLPYLEALELEDHSFVGTDWETAEGEFRSLIYLKIKRCFDLKQWSLKYLAITQDKHFPRLERLHLVDLYSLKEIPLGIADIHTLREISVDKCQESVVHSAKKILEEQKACNGEVELQIRVCLIHNTLLRNESFDSSNFTFYESGQ